MVTTIFSKTSPKHVQLSNELQHITFSAFAAHKIGLALATGGKQDGVVGLVDDLSFGPIKEADGEARASFMANTLHEPLDQQGLVEIGQFWDRALDGSTMPIIWLSRWSSMEHCGFLEWLWRKRDGAFLLVDLTDIQIPSPRAAKKMIAVKSTSLLSENEIADNQLWLLASAPDREQVLAWRALWERLRNENAPLPVISQDGLISAAQVYFDADIIGKVTPDWAEAKLVVGAVMMDMMYDCSCPLIPGQDQVSDSLARNSLVERHRKALCG